MMENMFLSGVRLTHDQTDAFIKNYTLYRLNLAKHDAR